MQVPAVGTEVVVVAENISRRHSWDPVTIKFSGSIAPKHKWLDTDYMCMTTGDPLFPIRSIRLSRIIHITQGGKTLTPDRMVAPIVQTGTWPVKGSKGDMYTVSRNGNSWRCDCVAGQFGKHTCKHIKQIQAQQSEV